jgi:predicted metal-dependent hydrolase
MLGQWSIGAQHAVFARCCRGDFSGTLRAAALRSGWRCAPIATHALKPNPAKLDARQLSLTLFFDEPAAPPAPAPAVDPVHGERRRQILLAGEPTAYRLRRGKRRTIGFQIDDNGLTVSAPRWVTLRDIEAAIVEKERWIRSKLVEWRDYKSRRMPQVRWACGGTLPYLGASLTLRLRPQVDATRLVPGESGHELHVALPGDALDVQIKDTVQAWLQSEARRVLGERIAFISAGLDTRPAAWSLSSARSQWGSCTHDGRVRLNWRLIHFALPVIDYVVAHELAHLKEMNHSPRFWSAVAQLLPGFEAARDEIKAVDLAALPI